MGMSKLEMQVLNSSELFYTIARGQVVAKTRKVTQSGCFSPPENAVDP